MSMSNVDIYLTFRFCKLRFVRLDDLLSAELPLLPSEFEVLVKNQCWEAHEELRKRYTVFHYILHPAFPPVS